MALTTLRPALYSFPYSSFPTPYYSGSSVRAMDLVGFIHCCISAPRITNARLLTGMPPNIWYMIIKPPDYPKFWISFSFRIVILSYWIHSKVNSLLIYYRMKLCYLLPKVKSTLKIPADKHLLQQLEMCVRKLLCQEKDKDVLAIVKRVSTTLATFGISCAKTVPVTASLL